jgi:hypothetical protein
MSVSQQTNPLFLFFCIHMILANVSTQYSSSMDCIRSTIRTGGVPSLFRGLTSTMAR